MSIVEEKDAEAGITILRPIGRVDSTNAPDMEKLLRGALDAGVTKVIFDLAQLDYISSAGLRVILMAAKKLRGSGSVVLTGMQEGVRDVFAMSGFLALFPLMAHTLEEGKKLL